MGQDFRYQCPVETWRLLWFLGIMFVVIMAFQHFELPSGYILSSISSVHSNQIAENGSVSTIGALSKPEIVSNMTHLNAVNPKDADDSHGHGREKHPDVNNDFASDTSVVSNNSSLIDNHDKESSIQQAVQPTVRSTADPLRTSGNRYVPEETGLSKNPRISDSGIAPFMPVLPPEVSSSNMTFPMNVESNMVTPVVDVDSNTSAVEKYETPILANHGKSGELKNKITRLYDNSSSAPNSYLKKTPETQTSGVISVMEMNNLLLQSWSSPMMRSPRWASPVDQELLQAKSQIENAPIIKNDPKLYAHLYWNLSMFKRSYEIMEENLKVYIYKEGEKPILHQPVLKGIYASEGWFMKQLEASKKFVTKKSRKAHLFYLPFSSRNLELQLYVPDSHSRKNLIKYLKNYLDLIVAKYPFWNRTEGVDHFLVACHDWAASETEQLMFNCIRALCNADVKEGFIFGKDASLPETNSDAKARGKMNYVQHMKSSRYCICARGYEVNSPRIVEAILYECVPVIISDNYVPPFFEVLNWESFAVFVLEKDIPNLKNILLSIPEKRYREMQMRVKMVQQHFLWHARPVKYDLFHMILHSVWYNRVFQMHPR
ncbi:catalytic, putative [Ricinus communis]|uniref:Catalytic, putative n=1 Tax=Ricinus communis TaxID=3988 RepID=B9RRY0_RICCO|nr:catalytic, putative [Ricinus communis]